MEVQNSLMILQEFMLADAGMMCSTSIDRDLQSIRSRVKHEGLSFLTIALPNFVRGFFTALERGQASPSDFVGFHTRRGQCLPEFLRGFTAHVFNQEGKLHETPNPDAVDAVRQIGLSLSKIRVECSRKRQVAAEAAFLRCERELAGFNWNGYRHSRHFGSVCRSLYARVFTRLEDYLGTHELVAFHGPGTTEDRTTGNRKWSYKRWTSRLERYFPAHHFLYANLNQLVSEVDEFWLHGDTSTEVLSREPPVRVVFVPKTLKSPRVIAIEPVHNQFAQQAVMRKLVPLLQKSAVRGHVNFDDQSINGAMALTNSLTREYCTIDLSEASDRVHSLLAFHLFDGWPTLRRAIFSCRSKYATLPSGTTIPLKKFASMGSALCFPVEAMVFNAICIAAILVHRGLPPTCENVRNVQRDVYVFGDDLIVPSREVDCVMEGLHSAGLKVNVNKTFVRSHFRESCGTDAFAGVKVTPVYVREIPPTSRREASKISSWIATANLFYRKGFWQTARWMRHYVESITGVVPHVPDDSPALGWYSFLGSYSVDRWNKDLQRFEVRGLVPTAKKVADPLDGYEALRKFFTHRSSENWVPLAEDTYRKTVRTGFLRLKSQWVRAA